MEIYILITIVIIIIVRAAFSKYIPNEPDNDHTEMD